MFKCVMESFRQEEYMMDGITIMYPGKELQIHRVKMSLENHMG